MRRWIYHRSNLERLRDFVAELEGVTAYVRDKFELLADPKRGEQVFRVFDYELQEAGVEPADRVVWDAGCGSGLYSVLFVLEGAKKVEAIDLMPPNVHALARIAERFSWPIHVREGNVAATDLQDGSVDVVYCNEAISHFEDWQGFLIETTRVLAPGGRLLVADWNNGANPRMRRSIRREWQRSECGPFHADDFVPGESTSPYLFRRWMIIRREFPDLSDDEVFHLGLRTVGIGGERLRETCREYVRTGRYPRNVYRPGISASRPEDAQHHEEPVDPREVVRILQGQGLEAEARAHFGFSRSRILPLVNRAASFFGTLSLLLSEKYRVHARRP